MKRKLPAEIYLKLIDTLKTRFEKNMHRHKFILWTDVQNSIESNSEKLWSLYQMEQTGGQPDVIINTKDTGKYSFYDCSEQSPAGRRSFCYDQEALIKRKENKPQNSALQMASDMGTELLTEEQYRHLQTFETFDSKTSGWIKTPSDIRKLGGALFADYRYGKIFIYHNGAESYYASRGFRCSLTI